LFADLKIHDIPRTVYHRTCALRDAGINMVTVQASGGIEMIHAAVQSGLQVFAVTILTSLSTEEVLYLYNTERTQHIALSLARWAWRAGVCGVTCSAQEVETLSRSPSRIPKSFLIVPGTRGEGMKHHDHKRVDGAACALRKGATHLVIGRELTSTGQYVRELDRISKDITSVGCAG
jgi:orotidine-5'-phosphate decarboxylase